MKIRNIDSMPGGSTKIKLLLILKNLSLESCHKPD